MISISFSHTPLKNLSPYTPLMTVNKYQTQVEILIQMASLTILTKQAVHMEKVDLLNLREPQQAIFKYHKMENFLSQLPLAFSSGFTGIGL